MKISGRIYCPPKADRHGARRRLFVNDSDNDKPPARCQRFDSPPPEYCPSPPPYRTPTPPLPEYESPIKGEEPAIEVQPHVFLVPPETENQADREREVNEQLLLERENRPVGQVQWEGEDGPQVAEHGVLRHYRFPQPIIQRLDDLLHTAEHQPLNDLEITAINNLLAAAHTFTHAELIYLIDRLQTAIQLRLHNAHLFVQQPAPVSPPHQPAPLNLLPLSPGQASPPQIPNAQIPPPLPNPFQTILFRRSIIVPGPVARGDAPIHINHPIENINLPNLAPPNPRFHQLVEQYGLSRQQLTIDLTLRRMFLLNGHLPPEDIEYVLENVPHAYDSNSPYLRALTALARGTYSIQQTIALHFCFSRLSQRALRNLINRH